MQGQDLLTIYVRKVDKTAIKLKLSLSPHLTSFVSNPEFLRFVKPDLSIGKANTQVSTEYQYKHQKEIHESIELYYGGDFIDKGDRMSLVKLKNISIVHVVVRKPTQPKQSSQSNPLKHSPHKTQSKIQSAAKTYYQQLVQTEQSISLTQEQYQPYYSISLNIKISNTTTLFNDQHKIIHINQEILPIIKHMPINIDKNQSDRKSILQTLVDLKLLDFLDQQIKSTVQNNDHCLKSTVQDKDHCLKALSLNKCILKLVHMGRAVSITIQKNEDASREVIPNYQAHWSSLNIFDKSQVIILVSLLQVQTQQVCRIINGKSLFLELEHTLTIRLYEQYKQWEKQWKSSSSLTPQHLISQLPRSYQQKISVKKSQSSKIPFKEACHNPINLNQHISSAFEPLKELREFYEIQKTLKTAELQIKNNQHDTVDDDDLIKDRFCEQQQCEKVGSEVKKQGTIKTQREATSELQSSILIF